MPADLAGMSVRMRVVGHGASIDATRRLDREACRALPSSDGMADTVNIGWAALAAPMIAPGTPL
jgi:hypothetical protein